MAAVIRPGDEDYRVPWPPAALQAASAAIFGQPGNEEEVNREHFHIALNEAARKAIVAWTSQGSGAPGSHERWLCVVDLLMDRLDLQTVPVPRWPVQLQLLGILANAEADDTGFFRDAAEQLRILISRETLPDTTAKALAALATLLRFRSTLLEVACGQLRTAEELHNRIGEAIGVAAQVPSMSKITEPLSKRLARRPDATPAPEEQVLAQKAEQIVRDLAWKLTRAAFEVAMEDPAAASPAVGGGTPLPPPREVREAVRAAREAFPTSWIHKVAHTVSTYLQEASAPAPVAAVDTVQLPAVQPWLGIAKRRRATI
mmetsp:Transcript_121130/g.241283  ORF Transcript_121130/g.241283 Transcript_121130/m.241283 type:complete len:316 (+) Transcript_121130:33-980(+)